MILVLFMILFLVAIGAIFIVVFKTHSPGVKQKSNREVGEKGSLFFGFSRIEEQRVVNLSCLNLKMFLLAARAFFFMVSVPAVAAIWVELDHDDLRSPGRLIMDSLDIGLLIFCGLLLIMFFLLIWFRVSVRLDKNGISINETIQPIDEFLILESFPLAQTLYLKNRDIQWILLPMTSEEWRSTTRRYYRANHEVSQQQLAEKREMLHSSLVI